MLRATMLPSVCWPLELSSPARIFSLVYSYMELSRNSLLIFLRAHWESVSILDKTEYIRCAISIVKAISYINVLQINGMVSRIISPCEASAFPEQAKEEQHLH